MLVQYFFGISIFLSSVFLVMLVLVQRGRGGGLTGALGGPGGQSAFGTKAGDLFTKITVGVATVWIFLCASAVFFLKSRGLPTIAGPSAMGASDIGANKDDALTLPKLDSAVSPKQPPAELLNAGVAPSADKPATPVENAQAEVTEFPPATVDTPVEPAKPVPAKPELPPTGEEANAPASPALEVPAVAEPDKK